MKQFSVLITRRSHHQRMNLSLRAGSWEGTVPSSDHHSFSHHPSSEWTPHFFKELSSLSVSWDPFNKPVRRLCVCVCVDTITTHCNHGSYKDFGELEDLSTLYSLEICFEVKSSRFTVP